MKGQKEKQKEEKKSHTFRRFLKKPILSYWYSKTISEHGEDWELLLTVLQVNEKLGSNKIKWSDQHSHAELYTCNHLKEKREFCLQALKDSMQR